MKVTVHVPDELYRQVKARAASEGRTVREVTVELYQRWLAGPSVTDEERRAAAQEWLRDWQDLTERITAASVGDPDESIVEWLIRSRR